MKNLSTKQLTTYGLFIALVVVATVVLVLPAFFTRGFVNLGDTMVLFSSFLWGGVPGMIIGGLGSAIADMTLGYYIYAPITLIVKGLEGFIAGKLFFAFKKRKSTSIWISYLSALWMAFGYYVAEIFLYGHEAALASTVGNLIQAFTAATAAWILYYAIGERIRSKE
ncbi:MAG: ECF transporter S component [Tissierellia bacterium]|nr:ECF transporter S component [Tissierellia bacterium]